MNTSITRPRASLLLGTALFAGLLTISAGAPAQDAAACTEPGLNLLNDATGDVDFQFLPAGLPVGPLDVESLHVAQLPSTDGVVRLMFTLKTGALTQLAPRQAWFASFDTGRSTQGVRMVVENDGVVSFESYAVLVDTEGNVTEGRYPETGSVKPAEAESSFDADGTIRIVVKADNIGLRKQEGLLSGFNAASLQQIPTGDSLTEDGDLLALVADGMPDDMSRSGEFAVSPSACGAAAKSAPGFGGVFGGSGLVVLLMLAGWRRRALREPPQGEAADHFRQA